MSASNYLRARKRWTMTDVVAAQQRMHELTKARGFALEPVTRDEIQKPALIVEPPAYKPTACAEPFGGFSFRLPWAPSVNSAYANRTSGEGKGRIKTSKARAFGQAVWIALAQQHVECRYLSHPLTIDIIQHASSDRGDPDNGIKVVLDVMKRYGVIYDDNRAIVKRVSASDGERVETGCEYIEVRVGCVKTPGKQA